ncbi:MAG: hypothetical protein AAGC67_13205 [Myxococcota bacterium]
MKTLVLLLALGFAILGCATPQAPAPGAPGQPKVVASDDDPLTAAFAELVARLRSVEHDIRNQPAYGDEQERIGGYRHLLRAVAKGLEAEVRQDPDYPYFRILDWWLREGGDNPDQRYAFSPIRGGAAYRVWGELGSAARVELQIYAGRPWDGTGRSAGYLTFEEIELAPDGSFEIWLTPERRAGNWLRNPPEGTTLFARHVYDRWDDRPTGDIHIDRIGFEGRRRPPETEAELAAKIRAASALFETTARTWPRFVQRRYVEGGPANAVRPPYDTYRLGGARGRWMSGGYFELAPGQALLVRMPKTAAKYQAIQLADLWMASLEHGNQVSSLTSTQSVVSDDGAYWYVIANEDPGHANWLDAGALRRGTILIRWDGVEGALDEDQFPSATLVALEDVPDRIPGVRPVTEAERAATRATRRGHLQRRAHR